MRDELCEPLALLPTRSEPRIRISEPSKSRIQKFIGGGSLPACPLPVERPAKNKLRRTIVFSSHPSEPMIDQGRLADTAPSNDRNNIDLLVCPGIVQESDILFP